MSQRNNQNFSQQNYSQPQYDNQNNLMMNQNWIQKSLPRGEMSTNTTSYSSLNNLSRGSKSSLLVPGEGATAEGSQYSLSSQSIKKKNYICD